MKSSNRNDIVLKASFGGQTRDIDGTRYSSSGGYATAISKQFILEKGVVQSPNQKIPDRKTKCVIKTHINIKQNVIFGAKLKPV